VPHGGRPVRSPDATPTRRTSGTEPGRYTDTEDVRYGARTLHRHGGRPVRGPDATPTRRTSGTRHGGQAAPGRAGALVATRRRPRGASLRKSLCRGRGT
jgi:hypothetical protein